MLRQSGPTGPRGQTFHMLSEVQLLHTFVTEMEGGYFEAITETAKVGADCFTLRVTRVAVKEHDIKCQVRC